MKIHGNLHIADLLYMKGGGINVGLTQYLHNDEYCSGRYPRVLPGAGVFTFEDQRL